MSVQPDDHTALRDYTQTGSQAAFERLVHRHLDWVYAAALRQVRDATLAQDVTQAAFFLLARKASRLSPHIPLSAWLFNVVRYESLALLRSERRRKDRQREAAMMRNQMTTTLSPDDHWQEISPLLDEAVARLGEADRRSILLRFYQQMSFAEVGAAMQTSEEAARKRVERAVGKLRLWLQNRGIVSPADPLPAILTAGCILHPAPPALAPSVLALSTSAHNASPAIIHLAQCAHRAALHAQLKLAGLVLTLAATIAIAAGGIVYLSGMLSAQSPVAAQSAPPPPTQSTSQPPPTPTAAVQSPSGTITFTGRIIDANGNPVANATVWPFTRIDYASRHVGTPTQTASDGTFSLTGSAAPLPGFPKNVPELPIIVHANVWSGGRLIGRSPVDIQLPSPAKVRAVFLDPAGNPVVGMPVRIAQMMADVFENEQDLDPPDQLSSQLSQTTDAHGAAVWTDLPREWQIDIKWDDPRFAQPMNDRPTIAGEDSENITIHLRPASIIRGRITFAPTGAPAPGIHLYAAGLVRIEDVSQIINAWATTDADGNYALTQLLPGKFTIALDSSPSYTVEHDWTTPAKTDIAIRRAQTLTGQDFVLDKGAVIQGTIRDAQTQAPIPQAYVGIQGPAHPAGGATGIPTTTTDSAGKYLLHVPPGEQTVGLGLLPDPYTAPPGQAQRNIDVAANQTAQVDFNVTKTPESRASQQQGTVVYADGKPAPGAIIFAFNRNGSVEFYDADADGHFVEMPDEILTYRAKLGPLESRNVPPTSAPLQLVLEPLNSMQISGRIVAPDGSPIPNATVSVRIILGKSPIPSSMERATDATGAFHITPLRDGFTYRLLLSREGYASVWRDAPLQNPSATPTVYRLEKADGTIRGRAISPDGLPLANVQVSVTGRATPYHEVSTDPDGSFFLPNIARNDRVQILVHQEDETIGRATARGSAQGIEIRCTAQTP